MATEDRRRLINELDRLELAQETLSDCEGAGDPETQARIDELCSELYPGVDPEEAAASRTFDTASGSTLFVLVGEMEGDYEDQYQRYREILAVSASHGFLDKIWKTAHREIREKDGVEFRVIDGERYIDGGIESTPWVGGPLRFQANIPKSFSCECGYRGDGWQLLRDFNDNYRCPHCSSDQVDVVLWTTDDRGGP